MRKYIENCIQTMKNEYLNNPKRIQSDHNRESEAIEVYKGRELLELIQNADDELLDGMGKEIRLSFIDNILTVSNNGSPFSEEGIDSLLYSDLSSKTLKKDVIGNKGKGFRAILGWANEIRIESGELGISFSDDFSQNVLREILMNSDHTKSDKEYRAATLVFPKWLDVSKDSLYTTDVSIHINNDQAIINDICKQLEDIDGELLLFLHRAEELTIETEEKKVSFKKNILDADRIIIEKYVNEDLEYKQEWLLNRLNGEFEGKGFSIVVAFNQDGIKQKKQVLYSYFPTDVEFPFPVLLHANFNLNSDRNHLTKGNKANGFILEQACKLLVDTALKITKDEVSYEALLVLAPQKPISKELVDYGFDETLLEEIKHSKVFPTVNGNYISFDECPKFYTSYLSQYLEGEGFDDLLISSENKIVCRMIRKLNKGNYPVYPFDGIVKRINRWAKSHIPDKSAMEKHAYCAVGFLEDYKYSHEAKSHKKMPLLIYDTDGRLVSNENSVFLSDRSSNISNPPSFAQIRFMHPDMRSSFEEIILTNGRNLATKLSLFGVKEYNTARIIEKMNSAIKNYLDDNKTIKARRFCELEMKWLWHNRRIIENIGEKTKIYFITRNSEVKISDELYIGKEYGNQICENLFEGLFEEKFVDDIKKYINTKESSIQEITAFLQTLGLDKLPKKKIERIFPNKCYTSKLLKNLHFPLILDGVMFKDLNDITSKVSRITTEAIVIDELEVILKNCETQHIIEWVKVDSVLSQILYTREELSNNKVEIIWGMKKNYRFLPLDKMYAYIYWQFETIPWIRVRDKSFNISECILSGIGNILEPILVEPAIDYYIRNIEGTKSKIRNDYEYIFGKLGVENDFADLPTEKIYSVLNILPEINSSESIAKRFYAALVKSDRVISDVELRCQAFNKYMECGEVLCNNGYQKIKESWYLDGKSICEKIANTYNLIEIPKRLNSSRIKRLLGVEKLVLEGEVVGSPEIHTQNSLFRKDFMLYKPIAFCYRLDSARKGETRRFSELDIILCINLRARYTGKEVELDDYDFILKDANTFYLKIPKTLKLLEEMKRSVSFSAAIANVLCSFIDVTECFPAFRELYGANEYSRKELIHQIFEDDSILERAKTELNYAEDTKEEFIRILSKCSRKNLLEVAELAVDIDFDNITAISNVKLIIDCFQQLSVEIDEYNAEQPAISLDLYNYYQLEISRLLPKYENLYRLHQFHRLKGKKIEEKKKLVEIFLNYENKYFKIRNSVHYDCETELVSQLGMDEDVEAVDLVSLYNENSLAWTTGIKNTEYIGEFLSVPVNMSYVYYAEYDELNRAYEELVLSRMADDEETKDDDEVIKPEVIHPKTAPGREEVWTNGKRGVKRTGFTQASDLGRIGFKGEKYVFDMLKEQYTSIKWVSENAKTVGVNPEGRAGLGYDIEYIDEKGNRRFVEVKSSKASDIVFYLSENEYDFAIKHISEYVIYFVSEVFSKKPKILILGNVFMNNEFNTVNYALDTKREYKVTANLV